MNQRTVPRVHGLKCTQNRRLHVLRICDQLTMSARSCRDGRKVRQVAQLRGILIGITGFTLRIHAQGRLLHSRPTAVVEQYGQDGQLILAGNGVERTWVAEIKRTISHHMDDTSLGFGQFDSQCRSR